MIRFLMLALLPFLLVGCAGNPAPVAEPPAPTTSPAESTSAESTPAETTVHVLPRVIVTAEDALVRFDVTPSVQMKKKSDGRVAQCKAGDARTCLSLCQDQTAVCVKSSSIYDEKKCQKLADKLPPCSDVGGTEPGSLCTLPADRIAPTQGAVGMFAADCKARSITGKNTRTGNKLKRYLLAREVPAVFGPNSSDPAKPGRYYITDHHHLSTGVLKAGIQTDRKNLFICAMADRKSDDPTTFWQYMEDNSFAWLYNRKGESIPYPELPPDLASLGDDPYRTLSRWVRNSCGYVKCGTVCGGDGKETMDLPMCKACPIAPFFLEFKWANYMRSNLIIPGIYELTGQPQAAKLRANLISSMDSVAEPLAIDEGLPGWNYSLIQTKLVRFDEFGCDE